MDRACTLPRHVGIRLHFDVDEIRAIALLDPEADEIAVAFPFFIAPETEQLGRGALVAQPKRGAAKTVDAPVLRYGTLLEGLTNVFLDFGQDQLVAIRPERTQSVVAKPVLYLQPGNSVGREALVPIRQRAFRYGESRLRDFPRAPSSLHHALERKVGHDGTRCAHLFRVIELIDVRCVEVHCLLDPAQAEDLGEDDPSVPDSGVSLLSGVLHRRASWAMGGTCSTGQSSATSMSVAVGRLR